MSVSHPGGGSVLYVVPTLGHRPEYLAEMLDSLQCQQAVDLGVVIVAPAGADGVRACAEERGVHFVEQAGSGIGGAINQGWRAFGSGYEFWAWLGDDDALMPGSAARAVQHLRSHPKLSMVYGQCDYVDADGRLMFTARPSSLAADLLRWGPDLVPQPGSVARASAISRAGYLDETLRYAMDLDLFLRLKEVGPIGYVRAVLARFRWHEGSTTVNSQYASDAEAREVRRRTWVGRRRIGFFLEPVAMFAGRVLYRLQRS